ncbi:hypothetical protein BGW38_009206 [Lunasporangiospora selenospora]|uniref:Magnesium transporter n=1 Tax=Lunasporangiospora selenospora TaxID=979761 RepID=A0A9P6K9G4_9FUNG|nr:hypothetical protein BGW38_009206 [Lunasporangiospora selenospora]
MIYRVVPKYGNKTPVVNISICSLVGSITVMACKAFGIALKLTFAGSNQLTHPSTYVFAILVAVCIVTQMNYFNKALEIFSTNVVMPIYYVMFTTATITASVILFQGFNTTSTVNGSSGGSLTHGGAGYADRRVSRETAVMNAFDEESLGLTHLHDEDDEDDGNDSDMTENEDRRLRIVGHHHHH